LSKQIEAYFGSFCYPSINSGEENHADVSIKYEDGTWEHIYRTEEFTECCNQEHRAVLAKVIIEHHAGKEVSMDFVKRMLQMPGRSYSRMTPAWLDEDMYKCSQVAMF